MTETGLTLSSVPSQHFDAIEQELFSLLGKGGVRLVTWSEPGQLLATILVDDRQISHFVCDRYTAAPSDEGLLD